jgi:hypothetical protein
MQEERMHAQRDYAVRLCGKEKIYLFFTASKINEKAEGKRHSTVDRTFHLVEIARSRRLGWNREFFSRSANKALINQLTDNFLH